MEEQFLQLWPVLQGSSGILAAIAAWRGFLAVSVPLVNTKLQAWFTKLLVESPASHDAIVKNKVYQAISLVLRMTIDLKLPTVNSLIIHESKEEEKRQTQILRKEDL